MHIFKHTHSRMIGLMLMWLVAGCVAMDSSRMPDVQGERRDIDPEKRARIPDMSSPPKIPRAGFPAEKVRATPSRLEGTESSGSSVSSKSRNEGLPPPLSNATDVTNQELLDSALDFIEVSNNFWEQGDLDNAIDALDKAYSLILSVNQNDVPEVLQQKEDLRVTISKRIIEVYASRFTAVNGLHKAIPLTMNRHVEDALQLFKGREKSNFLRAYQRSGLYRRSIVAALKKAGLPEELSWLPLIESGFNVRALSTARALGLWQFIASTGYKYGLKRDQWIDERMDPEKSTEAAIAYLKELHQIFGDWTTVLAAYNCGERRVLNEIRTQRINYLDNFWDLYARLPAETAFYVPKFLAVLHIMHDPKAHGIELPPLEEEIETEEVTIAKQVHLKTIADHLKVDCETLKGMNAELRRDLTPDIPYQIKVPQGRGENLLADLSELPDYRPPIPTPEKSLFSTPEKSQYKVRKGDTLSSIASKYRTSVHAIMAANGLKSSRHLKVGWNLQIPDGKGIAIASAGGKQPVPRSEPKKETIEYVVKKGDSLWTIANQYHTTTKAIKTVNRMKNSDLQVGQVLVISSGSGLFIPKVTETKKHKVMKGDTPYLIAKMYSMELSDFLRLNRLTPGSPIFPGQTLLVKAD